MPKTDKHKTEFSLTARAQVDIWNVLTVEYAPEFSIQIEGEVGVPKLWPGLKRSVSDPGPICRVPTYSRLTARILSF